MKGGFYILGAENQQPEACIKKASSSRSQRPLVRGPPFALRGFPHLKGRACSYPSKRPLQLPGGPSLFGGPPLSFRAERGPPLRHASPPDALRDLDLFRGSPSLAKEETRCTDTQSSSRQNLGAPEASRNSSSSSSVSNGGSAAQDAAAKKPQTSPSADSESEDVIIISPPSRIKNPSVLQRCQWSSSSSSGRRSPDRTSRRSTSISRRRSSNALTASRRRVPNGNRSKSSSSIRGRSIRRRKSSSIRRRSSSSIRRGSSNTRRQRRRSRSRSAEERQPQHQRLPLIKKGREKQVAWAQLQQETQHKQQQAQQEQGAEQRKQQGAWQCGDEPRIEEPPQSATQRAELKIK
ncbi:hypothetical protein Emag_002493 [Eimeria magna]